MNIIFSVKNSSFLLILINEVGFIFIT